MKKNKSQHESVKRKKRERLNKKKASWKKEQNKRKDINKLRRKMGWPLITGPESKKHVQSSKKV